MFRLFAPRPAMLRREVWSLELADGSTLEVLCVRHPRARQLKLSVDERGARLGMPMRASERSARAFLHQHRDWLQAQMAALSADAGAACIPGRTTRLPLRGDLLDVEWVSGRMARVTRSEDRLRFETRGTAPPQRARPGVARALRDFYSAEAHADVARWLPGHLRTLPRAPARIEFKRMSSQWGSLSPDGVVALDLSLVLARPSAFEYVLVHELCHLIHHDHSRAFWREVEARCPRWRDERRYFHAEGRRLKATLRALTA